MRLQSAPDLGDLQAQLDQSAANVARDRAALADARAAHEGLKREAEARDAPARCDRRASAATGWSAPKTPPTQIAALGERRAEAEAERAGLADAPDEIDAKRRALLSQLAEAESLRKTAADRLQRGRKPAVADCDKAATPAHPVAGRGARRPASAPKSG